MSAVIDFPALPTGDTDRAIDFLSHLFGDRVRIIVTIDPNRGTVARRDFQPDHVDAMRGFIDHAQGLHNIYYFPNPAPAGTAPPEKNDVPEGRCFHLDADQKDRPDLTPEGLLALVRAYEPPATAIVATGGGYQGIWLHDRPSEATRIEAGNKAIEFAAVGKLTCWNVNRLLRLPGTVNVLNDKKRAAGRVPALAYLVDADWSRTWSFERDQVPRLPAETAAVGGQGVGDVGELPEKVMKIIHSGDASRWKNDRSRAVFHVACQAVRAGWSDDRITTVLLDPANGISAHIREQSNPTEYAARQARRARQAVGEDWERNERAAIIADSQQNIRRALREIGVGFRYNEFAMRILVCEEPRPERHFDDAAGNHLRFTISDRFGFRPSKELFFDFGGELARENSYHPVRDYLDGLAWDGKPRLDGWLVTYCGAVDTEYIRAVGRIPLIAAVRRIYEPGCVFDEMLVFVDPKQGTGKSSTLRALCPDWRWFTDSLPLGARPKEVIELLAGKWIVEIAELAGMRRTEIEQVKAFLSRQVDSARLAYGRLTTEAPRHWVPFGTTNQPVFLKDAQNRRYWPVRVGQFDTAAVERDRDQLWAEAVAAHRAGESIRLDPSLWRNAAEEQQAHALEDPWLYTIEEALGDKEGRIATAVLFRVLDMPKGIERPEMGSRLAEIMRKLGWSDNERKTIRFADGKVGRGWLKGDGRRTLIAINMAIEYWDERDVLEF